ncbi:unnamed protein product [Parajaminaea phylloscopi]
MWRRDGTRRDAELSAVTSGQRSRRENSGIHCSTCGPPTHILTSAVRCDGIEWRRETNPRPKDPMERWHAGSQGRCGGSSSGGRRPKLGASDERAKCPKDTPVREGVEGGRSGRPGLACFRFNPQRLALLMSQPGLP